MKTYHVKTFGCQMNKSDSEKIAGLLEATGMELSSEKSADCLIFNTCCVRQGAENKFYGHLNRIKSNVNDKIIVVAGCLAQREKDNLFMKGADVVLGPQSIEMLPDMLRKAPSGAYNEEYKIFPAELPVKPQNQYTAWLPIITGCNNFCSYCTVPYVRGREKSLPFEKAVKQAGAAVAGGAAEITLLGQNVNSYGTDLYGRSRFAELLNALSKINGLKRIRFATSHPKDLDDGIIKAVCDNTNVCNHIHLPVQSGSSRILKEMRRGYTKEHYLELVAKIRDSGNISVTTDIMAGFPGETDSDFKDTMDIVNECRFSGAYTFIYSPRPGTKAFPLKEVDRSVTTARFEELMNAVEFYSLKNNKELTGKVIEVLVEGPSKKNGNLMTGRSDCNRLVHFEKTFEIKGGSFVKVKVTGAFSWYLKGELQ